MYKTRIKTEVYLRLSTTLLTLTFSSLILLSCTPDDQDQFVSNSPAAYSNSLAPSKWSSTAVFPLNLKISSDFDEDQLTAIKNSANAWSDSVENKIDFFKTSDLTANKTGSLSSYKDSVMGVYKLNSWPADLPSMALAVTQIYGSLKNSGSSYERIDITHADVLVNYDYFTFTTSDEWGYDLETVILHELGHFLGLYHNESSRSESVMYPTISRYNLNQYPLESDIENLESKYSLQSASHLKNGLNTSYEPVESVKDETSEEIILQFELMADGSEQLKIIKGDTYEKTTINCPHTKH